MMNVYLIFAIGLFLGFILSRIFADDCKPNIKPKKAITILGKKLKGYKTSYDFKGEKEICFYKGRFYIKGLDGEWEYVPTFKLMFGYKIPKKDLKDIVVNEGLNPDDYKL